MSDTDIHDYSNELELLQFIPPSPFWMCETILCWKLRFIFDRGEALTLPDDYSAFPDSELLSCAFSTVISDAFTYEAVSTYISVNELTTEEEDDVDEMDNTMDWCNAL